MKRNSLFMTFLGKMVKNLTKNGRKWSKISAQNDENQMVKYNRKAFGTQKIYKKIRMVGNGRILKGVPGIMIDNDQNKPNFRNQLIWPFRFWWFWPSFSRSNRWGVTSRSKNESCLILTKTRSKDKLYYTKPTDTNVIFKNILMSKTT